MESFSSEFGPALLADIISRFGIGWVWQLVRQFTGRGNAQGQVQLSEVALKQAAEAKENRETIENLRSDLRGYFFRMKEPWRSRLNKMYQMARGGDFEFSEDVFVRLLSKALEHEETWEKKERYLMFFSLLKKKPQTIKRGRGKEPMFLPSIEEELDKVHEGSFIDLREEKDRTQEIVKKAINALKRDEKKLDNVKLKYSFPCGFYYK